MSWKDTPKVISFCSLTDISQARSLFVLWLRPVGLHPFSWIIRWRLSTTFNWSLGPRFQLALVTGRSKEDLKRTSVNLLRLAKSWKTSWKSIKSLPQFFKACIADEKCLWHLVNCCWHELSDTLFLDKQTYPVCDWFCYRNRHLSCLIDSIK